jgi:RNA polymerase sigma factor (sigma-70 family)
MEFMILFCAIVGPEVPNLHKYRKLNIDEEIFRKIAQNDMAAFEELYHLTERSVYSFALSILKNHEDAMDILQETYLKIRGAAHLYKPMGKPLAWIFTITKNLAMSKYRMTSRTAAISTEDLAEDLSYSYVNDQEDKLVLRAALSILDMEEREIILLHAISGFKHREIAEHLGISLGTVLSKYHRGLNKLKKHLKEQGVLG